MISQLCVTTMANLTQESITNGSSQVYFSLDKDILPFMDKHWDSLTMTARKVTQLRFSLVCIQQVLQINLVVYQNILFLNIGSR